MKLDRSRRAIKEMVRAERERRPNAAMIERLSKRLADTRGHEPMLETIAPPAPARIPFWMSGAAVFIVAAGSLIGWRATHPPPLAPSDTRVSSTGTDRPTLPTEPSGPSAPAPERPAAIAAAYVDPPAISVDALPAAAPSARTSAAAAIPERKRPVDTAHATELDVVRRARVALASDPTEALAVASEHAREFPDGEFVQEREVIAVEALARLGRKEDALRRGRSLVEKFPRTPYVVRLEKALGEPLAAVP